MYEYKCKIRRIVDGDTIDVDIDLGFDMWIHNERIRVMGIDTPESRTRDLEEKKFGLAAKEFVRSLFPIGSEQIIKTHKDETGKYGRVLGDFILSDGKLFSAHMIENHHAVAYNGENKEELKEAHLINRNALYESGVITKED